MIFIKIAFKNIVKNWRHSIATLVSISAAFFTLCLFQGYLEDVENTFVDIYRHRQMFGDLIIEKKGLYSVEGRSEPWKFFLDKNNQDYLNQLLLKYKNEIEVQVRSLKVHGMLSNGRSSLLFVGYGYDLSEGERMRGHWAWNALYGTPLSESSGDNQIVVGQTLGKLLSCAPDRKRLKSSLIEHPKLFRIGFHCEQDLKNLQLSSMTYDGQLNAIDLDMVGFIDGGFKEVDSRYVNMSLKSAQTLFNTDLISHVTVLFKDESRAKELISQLQKQSDLDGQNLNFSSWKNHELYGETYISAMRILSVFRNFVVVIILTIATLSVLNTLIKVVKERTKEIGTLRSLGFFNRQIYFVFSTEAAGLAFLGIFIGAIGSLLFSVLINHSGLVYKAGMFVEPAPLTVAISLKIYLQACLFLMFLSICSCLVAVRMTLAQKISDNLSYA